MDKQNFICLLLLNIKSFLLTSFSEFGKELVGDCDSLLLISLEKKEKEKLSSSFIEDSFLHKKNKFSSSLALSLNRNLLLLNLSSFIFLTSFNSLLIVFIPLFLYLKFIFALFFPLLIGFKKKLKLLFNPFFFK